ELAFQFKDAVIVDGDNDLSTKNDQIRLTGKIKMDTTLDFKWLGWRGGNPEFAMTLRGPVYTELEVVWNATLSDRNPVLRSVPIGRILVQVGPMPVWVDLDFVLRAIVSAEYSAG